MRTTPLILGAIALLTAACGPANQPKLYRIALDRTPETTINEPSCFVDGMAPNNGAGTNELNYRQDNQWLIWDGVEGKQYLDMGTLHFKLGNAPNIDIFDMIEGGDKTFAAQRTVTTPRGFYSETRQTLVTVAFSDLGMSPTGTVVLKAVYSCNPGSQLCPVPNPAPDRVTCTATLNFVARQIVASQTENYTPKGG
jgi:hypothetical protein